MRIVEIEWTGPFNPKQVKRNKDDFYQVYGYHPVYGENVLLYIFRGNEWKREISTHKNIGERRIPDYFKPGQITVAVGKILDNKGKICLETIKEILVFLHSPAWNTEGIDDIKNIPYLSCDDVVIKNRGNKGGLFETVEGKNCFVR